MTKTPNRQGGRRDRIAFGEGSFDFVYFTGNYGIIGNRRPFSMPGEVSNELMYEVLKSVQAHVAIIREDMSGIKQRLTSVDTRLGLVHTDMAHLSDRMDKLESRMERVENRLNFGEQQQ